MNTFSRHRVRPAATSISVWTLAVLVACLGLHQLWAYLDVRAPHVADALLGGLVAAAYVYSPRERRSPVQAAVTAIVLAVFAGLIWWRTADLLGELAP